MVVKGPYDGIQLMRANVKGTKCVQESTTPIQGPTLFREVRVIAIPVQETPAWVPVHGIGQAALQCTENVVTIG